MKFLKSDLVPAQNGGSVSDARSLLFVVHFSPSQYVRCNYCIVINEKPFSESEKALLEIEQVRKENEKLKTTLDGTNHALQTTRTELFRVNQTLNETNRTLSETNRTVKKLSRKVKQLEEECAAASVQQNVNSKKRQLPVSSTSDLNDSTNSKPKKRLKTEFATLPEGIKYRVMAEGTGPPCKDGDKLSVYYVGMENKEVFDKCITGNEFEFTLGKGDVIKGWDIGIKGMRKMQKRKLIIPPEFAYGKTGFKPHIGPDATLEYVDQVRSINGV